MKTFHQRCRRQVFHPLRQPHPASNPCLNNGGCEALCLLVPKNDTNDDVSLARVCQCPQNFVLNEDGLTCRDNCSNAMFKCATTFKCIPFWWK